MDEWQEWRKKQEELEQEQKRKQEEVEKRARILREGLNCASCGKHIPQSELDKWKKDGRPICRSCRKEELRENVEKASPSQIKFLKLDTDDADLVDEIIKERKLKEQATPTKPTKPQKCPEGEEWNDDLHQCVKIEKAPPTREQIPAQPVVPVGPVTIEQKVAALNDEIAKMQKHIAFIFGVIGQRPVE